MKKKATNQKAGTFIVLVFVIGLFACKNEKKQTESKTSEETEEVISTELKWSERMLLSEIERFPEASKLDFVDKPRWSYTNGLVLTAAERVYKETNKQKYYDYIYAYADELVTKEGDITTYDMEKYNLDMIKSGDVLLYLYGKTREPRFKNAADTLRKQLEGQPRTSDGGFWHKKRYTHQMWLDGLYMAEPFYAHYTKLFSEDKEAQEAYDDIITQFDLIQKHSLDPKTNLLYHGWDESRKQKWADKKTGVSPNFWSRAMGWYGMAMVDVLDYLPEDHPGHQRLIGYLQSFAEAVSKVQDQKSGLWYQVLDRGPEGGNYLEATGSSMFVYSLAKAVRKGYISETYLEVAKKGYNGILENLISVEDNGLVNLNQCCAVAGLGGDPYRDGTFEYYVNEKIRSNDPKGTGPFIMASLELER